MAYITIHPIKSTLKKAIDYICNPQKTENQKNISSMFCNFKTADKMFERTRKNSNSNVKLLAFHVVQSFKKGEVTAGQAQAVGRETVRRFLHDEYEFVIATHNDTNCIHNHIIINSLNMITGKSFSREHDRKNAPAWNVLRKISDEILIENGLSVIEEPEKTGKSHYEWSVDKQGKSWKSKLRKIIDETIRNSSDFESFTEQLKSRNISVRYEPYKTKEGMILAFKMEGQRNFIYSQKLGKYYLENAIKRRIERCVRRKDMNPIERRQERMLNDDGVLKRLYDVSEFKEVGLREWAKKENRKLQMQTLNILHERGFSSAYEFNNYYTGLQTKISDNSNLYSGLKDKKQALQVQLKYVEIYHEYKEIYDYYKNKTLYPDRYFRRHEKEILMFEEAVTELEKYGENIPGKAQLKNELLELESVMTELRMKNREYREELYSLGTLKHNIDIIYSDKSEDLAEKKLSEKPTEKQKNKDNEIEI